MRDNQREAVGYGRHPAGTSEAEGCNLRQEGKKPKGEPTLSFEKRALEGGKQNSGWRVDWMISREPYLLKNFKRTVFSIWRINASQVEIHAEVLRGGGVK